MEHSCFTHPTRQALSFCHSCGRYFCSDCLVESDESYYCRDESCQKKLREDKLGTQSEYDEQEDKAGVFKRISRLGTWIWPHTTDADSTLASQKKEQEILGVKMKRKDILFYISVLVVILASILWLLYQKREHDRLIAFEQKKQEARQLMIEEQLLIEKLDERLSVAIDAEDTSELREKSARLLDKSKYIQQGTKSTLAGLETLRNVSDKEALRTIERIVTGMQENNKRGRELLEQFDTAFYYNRGNDHRDKGKYDEAISDYTKALEIDPTLAEAYGNRGTTYGRKGQYDKAISDFTKALEINPKDALAYYNRGLAYYNKGQYGEAISDGTEALKINPRYAAAYYNRGLAYGRKGQYDDAISDFTKALEIDPRDALAYYNRGFVYNIKGQYAEAIWNFTKALEIDPKYAEACNELAWLLATAKEPSIRNGKKAVELALRVCELSDWKNPDYLDTLAAAYARADDFINAVKWQKKALQLFEKDEKAEAQERLNLYRKHRPWPSD